MNFSYTVTDRRLLRRDLWQTDVWKPMTGEMEAGMDLAVISFTPRGTEMCRKLVEKLADLGHVSTGYIPEKYADGQERDTGKQGRMDRAESSGGGRAGVRQCGRDRRAGGGSLGEGQDDGSGGSCGG